MPPRPPPPPRRLRGSSRLVSFILDSVLDTRAQIVGASIPRSTLWEHAVVLQLRVNMRLGQSPEDRTFAQWLREMSRGEHTDEHHEIALPQQMQLNDNSLQSLINHIYGDIQNDRPLPTNDKYFLQRTILSSRNSDVTQINAEVLQRVQGDVLQFKSADSVHNPESETEAANEEDPSAIYPPEFLHSLNASALPLAKLELKIGCPIMILHNINPLNGACNGSRAILTRTRPHVLEVEIIGGCHAKKKLFIPRITCTAGPGDVGLPFELRRRQFPVRLAFSMTINKSQGQSVAHVGLDLRVPVFTHGQLYVALSRVTSASRIKVLFPLDSTNTKTKNIVYKEILLQN